jgi:hypothetical protein
VAPLSNSIDCYVRARKQAGISISTLNPTTFFANLAFLLSSVVASESLLQDAISSLEARSNCGADEVLLNYYRAHLQEERGHFAWLREDLLSANVEIAPIDFDTYAMQMIGQQYFMIKHVHPAALLGYLAVVEGDPTPLDVIDILEGRFGKPLLRFARFHAEKDLEHRLDLFKTMDALSDSTIPVIWRSAELTLERYIAATATWN